MHDIIARNYNYFKLSTKAVVKEIEELLKDDRFTLGGLINTLPFIILN